MTENNQNSSEWVEMQMKLLNTQIDLEKANQIIAEQQLEINELQKVESECIDLEKEIKELSELMTETEDQFSQIDLENENYQQRVLDNCQNVRIFFESLQTQLETIQSLKTLNEM